MATTTPTAPAPGDPYEALLRAEAEGLALESACRRVDALVLLLESAFPHSGFGWQVDPHAGLRVFAIYSGGPNDHLTAGWSERRGKVTATLSDAVVTSQTLKAAAHAVLRAVEGWRPARWAALAARVELARRGF